MKKTIVAYLFAISMAFSIFTCSVSASESLETNEISEIKMDAYSEEIAESLSFDRSEFLSFDTQEEADKFVSAFYHALQNPVKTEAEHTKPSIQGRAFPCCFPDARYTYTTKETMSPDYPISAFYFVLNTDYFCECTDTSPTAPHKPYCRRILDTIPDATITGLTFGYDIDYSSLNSRIFSTQKGFETWARGTIKFGVDIGGVGNLFTVPFDVSHTYTVKMWE